MHTTPLPPNTTQSYLTILFKLRAIASAAAPVRITLFLVVLVCCWIPWLALVYFLIADDANTLTIWSMGGLFVLFLLLWRWWNRQLYRQPHWWRQYGLVGTKSNGIDLVKGWAIGLGFCASLFILENWWGWLEFRPYFGFLPLLLLEGFVSASLIALAEETVFRGWILTELNWDYTRQTSGWANAIVFAGSHFLKPPAEIIRTWPTFPALVILGITLVWARWSHGDRLGICIGLHAGLVGGYYWINVGQLVTYSDTVPLWLVGVDQNPIAGVMGIVFLSILALWMGYLYRKKMRLK